MVVEQRGSSNNPHPTRAGRELGRKIVYDRELDATITEMTGRLGAELALRRRFFELASG